MPFLLQEPSCRQHTTWPLEMYQSWGIEKTVVYTSPKPIAGRNQKGWSGRNQGDLISSPEQTGFYTCFCHTAPACLSWNLSKSRSFSVPSKDVGFRFARALNNHSCSWSQRELRSEHTAKFLLLVAHRRCTELQETLESASVPFLKRVHSWEYCTVTSCIQMLRQKY